MNSTLKQLLHVTYALKHDCPLVNIWFKMVWSSCLWTANTAYQIISLRLSSLSLSLCACACVCVSIIGMSKRMVPKVLCMAATKLMVNWWLHYLMVSTCTSSSLPLNFKKWFNNLTMVSFWIYCTQDGSNYSCGTDSTPHTNFAVKQPHLIYGPVFICSPVSWYIGHSYEYYSIILYVIYVGNRLIVLHALLRKTVYITLQPQQWTFGHASKHTPIQTWLQQPPGVSWKNML